MFGSRARRYQAETAINNLLGTKELIRNMVEVRQLGRRQKNRFANVESRLAGGTNADSDPWRGYSNVNVMEAR